MVGTNFDSLVLQYVACDADAYTEHVANHRLQCADEPGRVLNGQFRRNHRLGHQ
jgi:hypothetical protein